MLLTQLVQDLAPSSSSRMEMELSVGQVLQTSSRRASLSRAESLRTRGKVKAKKMEVVCTSTPVLMAREQPTSLRESMACLPQTMREVARVAAAKKL